MIKNLFGCSWCYFGISLLGLLLSPCCIANQEHGALSSKIWKSDSADKLSGSRAKRPPIKIPIDKDPAQEKLSADLSEKFDEQISSIMTRWQIPGAELAISKNGQIIFLHAYGFADLETNRPVHCHDLFRIASVSKCITATAIGKLIEEGKLRLDDRLVDLLPELFDPSFNYDELLKNVNVANLLNMTAGWDRNKRGEVLFVPKITATAKKYGTLCSPDLYTVCKSEFSKKLDHDPGADFSYSNLAYALLGKIIERKSNQDYVQFCREKLFDPHGLTEIKEAHRLRDQLLQNEVSYYPEGISGKCKSIFALDMEKKMPAPYGQIDIERYIPSFGWVANAESLLKFCASPLLSKQAQAQLFQRPSAITWKNSAGYFASGWELNRDYSSGSATFFKDGTLNGSRAFVIRYPDGVCCVALFNTRPKYRKGDPFMKAVRSAFDELDRSVSSTSQ